MLWESRRSPSLRTLRPRASNSSYMLTVVIVVDLDAFKDIARTRGQPRIYAQGIAIAMEQTQTRRGRDEAKQKVRKFESIRRAQEAQLVDVVVVGSFTLANM